MATPLAVVGAEGRHLYLADGRKLLDGLASWWTACHGYRHPYLIEQINAQLDVLPHVMFGGIQHEGAAILASRLATLLPGDLQHVFFCDSGSVAVEVAMKMAVQFWLNQGVQGRTKFISFRNAYHGDTLGAMSVCDPTNSMHAHFHGWLPQQVSCELPRNDENWLAFAAVLERYSEESAAVILEPLIQGAGGMKFHSPQTLARVAEHCKQFDLLLIADEIAVGFGRTGTMFACEQAGVVPDIICLGKALSGGMMSFAAAVANGRVFEAFWSDDPTHALMHGPTYMANPLACAAANASLDLFEREPRLRQVAHIEQRLSELLSPCENVPGVVEVRTRGAVGVIELVDLHDIAWLREAFLSRNLWLRPFAKAVYCTPSYTITDEELEQLGRTMCEVVQTWSQEVYKRR